MYITVHHTCTRVYYTLKPNYCTSYYSLHVLLISCSVAVIGCTMTIAKLRELVDDPLRLIENCVMKSSSNTHTPTIACCSEVELI